VGFAGHASAHEALTDPNDAAIIAGIVALAKSLRLITVAEGVETFEQHKYLHDLQCDLMQGCYLSEPLAASVFEDRLLNSPPQLPAVNTDNVAHLQGRIRRRQ
jgi:EAL domain-containing protein (putative c-di-GMP-specific phosphodiesterase class I)